MNLNVGLPDDFNPSSFDVIVVGAGYAGAVCARRLAEACGSKVCILERRGHVAGNAYDYRDEAGVLVHKYGPHIFHTADERAFQFLSRFTDWTEYQHKVLADVHGTLMPVPFNHTSLKLAFGEERGERLFQKLVATFGMDKKVPIMELREKNDPDLSEVADYVYENVFLHYTMKQWGKTPDQIDPSVMGRVPVFVGDDDRYFPLAPNQGMPADGYTAMFERMLDHDLIKVYVGVDARDLLSTADGVVNVCGRPFGGEVIYTGPLDELYGFDLSGPAKNAKEAVQWTYFGYLASVKSQDGAAMSIGRLSGFLDVYFERDLKAGLITESDAQEMIDAIVIKLRITRFLRTIDYDQIFSGDPYWATWSDAGFGEDGRTLVTKTSFRLLQTLRNLGPAPEPNITIFWSPELPAGYKEFCAAISIETSSIQYESDPQIRGHWGDDAAIACCVSPMRVGKQMQLFGARVNAGKALLYAINGGRDEMSGKQIVEGFEPVRGDGPLDFDDVWAKYEEMLDWVVGTYVEALNIIHYCHDRYAYEAVEMALHDSDIVRTMGCGIAGLSIVADSLSAIKYAKVTPVRDETGLIVDYLTEGDFPTYGNDDDRADDIAATIVHTIMDKIKAIPMYRDAIPTQSVLTITSNVVYGRNTGSFPSGHRRGTPFSPGANPENGMDTHGMLASMLSVGKLDYEDALDGISLTNTITPSGLGRTKNEQVGNLVAVLDGGFIPEDSFLS